MRALPECGRWKLESIWVHYGPKTAKTMVQKEPRATTNQRDIKSEFNYEPYFLLTLALCAVRTDVG